MMKMTFKQLKSPIPLCCVLLAGFNVTAQNMNVDINLNMKHSVDGVSDFGRNRHMTIHSNCTESDWNGEEAKLDYLINDLGVYFGRETGNATWKNLGVEEDPNHRGWPNEAQMIEYSNGLKKWSEGPEFDSRDQYRVKSANMIMGVNDFSPMYANLSWFDTFGKGKGGWFVKDVDASAEWTALYLDHFYAKSPQDIGEPLPRYWECYNEPDMNFMNPSFGMIISSLEKNWQYHKLTAQAVRAKLGDKAPKIGGMTWGQHDFYKPDGVPSRAKLSYWTQYLAADNPMIPVYENMLSGVNDWPKAWDRRTDKWWQWDYLWQGFIDYCGADMDFYGVHIYDWPSATKGQATIRSGGHTEAMLDQLEWYDNFKFGKKKDIVISEFGAVGTSYINSLPARRRDWEFLKPFNQMFMEFLERPSQVVMSIPFAPTKAIWGAYVKPDGNVQRYDGATLFDPIGTWQGNKTTSVLGTPSGGWDWSAIIYYFQLWKDVDGTRIDTKSNNLDVQADAYVKDNHVYVILNNCEEDTKTVNLNTFNSATANVVRRVNMRHLYFDATLGTQGEPALSVVDLETAPAQVTLKPNSTIVLDYTYASNVVINKESKEKKYMSEPLTTAKNSRGTQLCRLEGKSSFTTTVKNVVKPQNGEAMIRIGGFFYNPVDGGNGKIKVVSLKVNGNEVVTTSPMLVNPRGYVAGGYAGGWFGVLEIECPIQYLKDGENTIYFQRQQSADFTTCMIQVWDMDEVPGRSANTTVQLTSLSLGSSTESLMYGNKLGIEPIFTPSNASNKGLVWSSSNTSVAKVDENGVVTAVASSGSAIITATSLQTGSIIATKTIEAIPYSRTVATALSINQGEAITVDYYVNTPLTVDMLPIGVIEQDIEWSSNNEKVVSVLSTGKVIGKVIGGSAIITAKVKGTNISDAITVNVRIAGPESVFTREMPSFLRPFQQFTVDVPVRSMGERRVDVELSKNGTILGSGTTAFSCFGDTTIKVTYTLADVPAIGTGYLLTAKLKHGSATIATADKELEMKDHIRVLSVKIVDGLPSISVGSTLTRSVEVLPSNAFNKNIVWRSSSPDIAMVDASTGVITGVSAGMATITAASADNSDIKSTIEITVQNGDVTIPVTNISLPANMVLFPGASRTIEPAFVPYYTTQKGLQWSSSNQNVATVDGNGIVTAKQSEGSVNITATSTANSRVLGSTIILVSKTITIEAEDFVQTGGASNGVVKSTIGFNNNTAGDWADYSVDFPVGGDFKITYKIGSPQTSGLGVKMYVDGALISTATLAGTGSWETYTEQVVSALVNITQGKHTVRIESTGTQEWQWNCDKIMLTFQGSTLPVSVDGVAIVPGSVSVGLNGTTQLTANVSPLNASNKNVVWHSSDDGIATVNTSGLVSGIKIGTVEISVTTSDGSFKSKCTVTVTDKPIVTNTLKVEAESYVSTGGMLTNAGGNGKQGFQKTATGINWNQAGDWADYTVDFVQTGDYSVSYFIGSPSTTGIGVKLYVDGVLKLTTALSGTGNWEVYSEQFAQGLVSVMQGIHTVRIESFGATEWQWNCDWFKLNLQPNGFSLAKLPSVNVYPSPATDFVTVEGDGIESVIMFNAMGHKVISSQANINQPIKLSLTELANGMYILLVRTRDAQTVEKKIIVNHCRP